MTSLKNQSAELRAVVEHNGMFALVGQATVKGLDIYSAWTHVDHATGKMTLKLATSETSEAKRRAAHKEAQRLMLSSAPLIPLFVPQSLILVKPKVKGLLTSALDGGLKGDMALCNVFISSPDQREFTDALMPIAARNRLALLCGRSQWRLQATRRPIRSPGITRSALGV